mmetsp:Transcript_35818/g.45985  ORF Transcript_35818/g.45985 Transcript_35818/m.45985 type:complete len:1225 (+) Transcript_35818:183-3857(+)
MASEFVGKIKGLASISISDIKNSAKNILCTNKSREGITDLPFPNEQESTQIKSSTSRRKLTGAMMLDKVLNNPKNVSEFLEEKAMGKDSAPAFLFLIRVVQQPPPKRALQTIIEYAGVASYLHWVSTERAAYEVHLSGLSSPNNSKGDPQPLQHGAFPFLKMRIGTESTQECSLSSSREGPNRRSSFSLSFRGLDSFFSKCSAAKPGGTNSSRRSSERKISPIDQSSSSSPVPFANGLTVEVPPNLNKVGVTVYMPRKFKRTKPNPRDPKYKEKIFFQEMEDIIFRKLESNPPVQADDNNMDTDASSPTNSLGKLTISPKLQQSVSLVTLENGGLSPMKGNRTPPKERSPFSFTVSSPARSRSRSTSSYMPAPSGSRSARSLSQSDTVFTPNSKLLSCSRDQLDWTTFVGGYFNVASREHKAHHLHLSAYRIKDSVIKKNYKYLIRPGRALPQRRNSTNSLPLYYCQENGRPDTFAIMKVVCVCLHYQIVRGCELPWEVHPDFALFDDRAMRRSSETPSNRDGTPQVPTLIDVYQFFKYIFKTAQLERDCIIMSIIYIDRLLTESSGKLKMCNTNWKSIILAGMILASKVWDDLSMWNCDFSEVGRLNLKRINQLEAAVLHALQFNVRVAASLYARYHYHLRSWCVRFGIGAAHEKRRHSQGTKTDLDLLKAIGIRAKGAVEEMEVMYGVVKRKCKKPADTVASLEEVVDISCTHPDGREINPLSVYEYRFQRQVTTNLDPQDLLQSLITLETGAPEQHYHIKSNGHDGEDCVLGVGLSGVVQVVEHKKSGMKYAMKTLYLNKMIDSHRVEELRNEIDILSHLNHPNITRLMEVYEVPGEDRLSLVVELCMGCSLQERLHQLGFFGEGQCAGMVRKMLSAVRHIHINGIIHRDLNLENWLFETPEEWAELKLIDVGLSRHFCKGEVLHLPIGTPYTMAPEVLQGSYTQSCDLWSMGVIAYMLLFGKQPFKGEDEFAMFNVIKKGKYDLCTRQPDGHECSSDALDFLKGLLVIDPKMRMTAKDALNHPWIMHHKGPPSQPLEKEVLESLLSFHRLTALMKLIYNLIAYLFEPQQVEQIRKQFESLDVDCDGEISVDDLMKSFKGAASEAEIHQLFEDKLSPEDMDLSGFHGLYRIRYNDYLAANVRPQVAGLSDPHLHAIFDKLDRNHSGSIEHSDIREFLGEHLTEEEIDKEMESCGLKSQDGSRQIEYQQFCAALRKGGILSK